MDKLIDVVSRRAGLTPVQACAAVTAVLEYFTANLPSPVVGRIRELLRRDDAATPPQNGSEEDSPP